MILCEITKQTRAEDIHIEYASVMDAMIYISQNTVVDDGYRLIDYQSLPLPAETSLRPGSHAIVRAFLENETQEQEFETLELALIHLNSLNDSDGYELIDLEQPVGSSPSVLLSIRPSLWNAVAVASRQNAWGRTDTDRF